MSEVTGGIKAEIDQKVDDLAAALKIAIRSGAEAPAELGALLADALGDVSELAASTGERAVDILAGKIKDATAVLNTAVGGKSE